MLKFFPKKSISNKLIPKTNFLCQPLVRIIYEQQGHHRIIILEEKRRRKKNQERSKIRPFQHKYFRVVYVAAKDQGIYVGIGEQNLRPRDQHSTKTRQAEKFRYMLVSLK